MFDRAVKCITTQLMFDCRGVNLSLGGICLRSPITFESGEDLALLIPVGSDEGSLVIALGKVIWMQQYEESLNDLPVYAGISFIATAGKFQGELNKLFPVPG